MDELLDVAELRYDFYSLAIAKLLNDQYFRLLDFYFHILIQQRQLLPYLFEQLHQAGMPLGLIDEFPLFGLFVQMCQAGLPLEIDDYGLLLKALQGGFGLRDQASLKRLCQTLWVKSEAEHSKFDECFEKFMPSYPVEPKTDELSNKPESKVPDSQEQNDNIQKPQEIDDSVLSEKNSSTNDSDTKPPSPTPNETRLKRLAIPKLKEVSINPPPDDIPSEKFDDESQGIFLEQSPILSARDYFPVRHRQIQQIFRGLRHPMRQGLPVELDIEATVQQTALQGFLLEPLLKPAYRNQTELLLLCDFDGSMVPFHGLSRQLAKVVTRLAPTTLTEKRFAHVGFYYFHNCPIEYLYRDSYLFDEIKIENVFSRVHLNRAVVLIFSDAGAARGGYNEERKKLTKKFLDLLKQKVRHTAWVNPLPRERWYDTTADAIKNLVPMFEFSLQDSRMRSPFCRNRRCILGDN